MLISIAKTAKAIGLAFLAANVLIVSPCFAEAAPLEPPQAGSEQVDFLEGGVSGVVSAEFAQNPISDWWEGVVEFLSFVLNDFQAMTNEEADKEGEDAEKVWIQWILMPIIWFIFGLYVGGGFGR